MYSNYIKTALRRYKKALFLFIFILMISIYPLQQISKMISTSIVNTDKTYRVSNEISVDYGLDIKIYDNFENINTDHHKAIFSNIIVDNIEKAEKEIYIAMYSFNIAQIKNALQEAKKRGIDITLIYNLQFKKNLETFLDDAIDSINLVYVENNEGSNYLMHHKFMLIDPKTSNGKLFTGPWNWSELQEDLDPNIVFEIEDKEIIASYYNEVKRILDGNYGNSKFKDWSYLPWDKTITYPSGESVEVWWSPGRNGNSTISRISDLINEAEETIDIAITIFDSKPIAKKLIKKAQEGVEIKIIVDVNTIDPNETVIVWFKNKIKELELDNINIYFGSEKKEKDKVYTIFHYHNMVIDNKITFTSTGNWTYGGFWLNDENSLIFHSEKISKDFTKIFERYLNFIN